LHERQRRSLRKRNLRRDIYIRESDRATLRARETRIVALETQIQDYRRQLAKVIERAVTRNRTLTARNPRPAPRMSVSINHCTYLS